MTTTVTPDTTQLQAESQEWPPLDLDPTHTTHEEPDAHSFDPTQGRGLGSDPYDDPPRAGGSALTRTTTPRELARLSARDGPLSRHALQLQRRGTGTRVHCGSMPT
jgi:hypothetical protein